MLTPTATPAPTPTDPRSTPEGATRAFFAAFAKALKTNDPSLVEPYVTSKDSSAYLTVSGWTGGAQGVNRASVVTVERLDNMTSRISGDTATVDFDYTEGGYDINPSTGAALETPTILAPAHVTATLKLVNGLWLMDSYVGRQ
jgi:mannitol-1-phosphate/altronate dehydrogenase